VNQAINPRMIVLARQARGVTQQELTEHLNIGQGTLSKLESGLARVSLNVLEKLAKFFHYPREFFYEPLEIYPPGLHFYRKHKTLPQKEQSKLIAAINIQRMHIQKLLLSADIDRINLPEFDAEEYEQPEDVARAIRQYLRLPSGPVENMTNLLENIGMIVIHRRVGTRLFSGVSLPTEDAHQIIFINRDMPGDRMRYTLAHELAHVVMHRIPTPSMEDEADRFAAEFLMPERDIRSHLRDLTLEKLASLKPHWKVAMSALLQQAKNLGQITERHYRTLWTEMGARGYRLNEPIELDISREQPLLLSELIDFHIKRLKYSVKDLSHSLRLFMDEFMELYMPPKTHLRLVHQS
jgi:Zn-dependent peptidase ImmA (M78 family)/DNA-binding XRE family transcriptional regulator